MKQCGLVTVIGFMLASAFPAFSQPSVFIRMNQVGFLPGDQKSGVVCSERNLRGQTFRIMTTQGHNVVYEAKLPRSAGAYGTFGYHYRIEFSSLEKPGEYVVEVAGEQSYPFTIAGTAYDAVVDSLLLFFRIQRCGNTTPVLHDACHLHDATRLFSRSGIARTPVDVTGGWHDAGDYVKFLNTSAFAAYMLLFTYEFDPTKFRSDRDSNRVPDILDEARVGLVWLMKLCRERHTLITQVQDSRDHDQGWRMPERDRLERDRPAFVGSGKNLIGIYAATMALAYRVWTNTQQDRSFADSCLTLAENFYSVRHEAPDLYVNDSGVYQDKRFHGKMALAAAELYLATRRNEFLLQARAYADSAGPDYWWSWGDVNALAFYRLGNLEPQCKMHLLANLRMFNVNKTRRIYGEAVEDSWGSNTAILGAALQSILWHRLTAQSTFDTLAIIQRDFILGRNQWGVSFVNSIGTDFSRNPHSQVGYFNGGRLPGAVAAGPISKTKLDEYHIPFEQPDRYERFQTTTSTYRDDRMDYVTNEPTITTNATAVFVMGYFASPR